MCALAVSHLAKTPSRICLGMNDIHFNDAVAPLPGLMYEHRAASVGLENKLLEKLKMTRPACSCILRGWYGTQGMHDVF
jgi:hypothetical protein